MTSEVITLQIGNYSNYVGAHYWNIQESQFVYSDQIQKNPIPDVNHDVLFREGISAQNRITFCPRMILFDLKENINFFKAASGSAKKEDVNSIPTWKGEVKLFESDKMDMSNYSLDLIKNETEEVEFEKNRDIRKEPINYVHDEYQMDDEVKYWSDYLKVRYHERSYSLITKYSPPSNDSEPFDLFNFGSNAFDSKDFLEEYEDKLRHFAEECDHIQVNLKGFQLIVDAYNGFGGVSQNCLNLLNEEYPKKPIFTFLPFPYYDDQAHEKNSLKLINSSFTIKNLLMDHSDLILLPLSMFDSFFTSKQLNPIKLNQVNYKPNLNYHTSAILALLIDSVTLPWRQKSQHTYMYDINSLFDTHKYKIASLQAVWPLEMDNYLFNYLQDTDLLANSTWFTPFCSKNSLKADSSSFITGALNAFCKGIPDSRVKNIHDNAIFKDIVPAYTVLEKYFEDMYPKCKNKCFSTSTPLNIKLPFPDIVQSSVGNSKDPKQRNMSCITILQMNKSILNLVKFIDTNIEKMDIHKKTKYLENGLEYDDFVELINFNHELTDIYSI